MERGLGPCSMERRTHGFACLRQPSPRNMKSLITPLLTIWLVGCQPLPVSEPEISGKFSNACLPEAAIMTESLIQSGIEAELIIMDELHWSHAVVAFVYPADSKDVWVWDSKYKSIRVQATWGNTSEIISAWKKKVGLMNSEAPIGN